MSFVGMPVCRKAPPQLPCKVSAGHYDGKKKHKAQRQKKTEGRFFRRRRGSRCRQDVVEYIVAWAKEKIIQFHKLTREDQRGELGKKLSALISAEAGYNVRHREIRRAAKQIHMYSLHL